MPKFRKFMKDILRNKKSLEDHESVMLNEECSVILLNKLPPKLKDPKSFSIPCKIKNCQFGKALYNPRASINLISLSFLRKLGIREATLTMVSLQLADRLVKYPRGVIEDVLVKVDKLYLPADFIILHMEENKKVPIILVDLS